MHPAAADAAGERRRALLSKIHRIAVVPPIFGTQTLDQPDAPKTRSGKSVQDAKLKEYTDQLRLLERHAREWLGRRMIGRTDFKSVPPEETDAALKEPGRTPRSLFQNDGRMKGRSFPAPLPGAVRALAQRLHADAMLLTVMDEPRRNSGAYLFDPLTGITYDNPKVRMKFGFWLLLADGTEVMHSYVEVLHPVSRIGSRTFLLADWTETEDEVIEDFMDELTRYTPVRAADARKAP